MDYKTPSHQQMASQEAEPSAKELSKAVASFLQTEAAVKTTMGTLQPFQTEKKRAKQFIENHLLQSNDESFVTAGSKFFVKETTSTVAPLSMDIIKYCYSKFRTDATGQIPSQEEVDLFESLITAAQKQLGGQDTKVKRKPTKPISYLLGKR
jgi:hypothetical protein